MSDAMFNAFCLATSHRRFWTSPKGVVLNTARIFLVREIVWLAKEIQAL
jgi:hypothetical protein